MKIKLLLILLLAMIITSCSNHTDPHIYFLQVQKQAIGENIKKYEKRNHLVYFEKKSGEKGNIIFKYLTSNKSNCIQVIEVNSDNVIVGVDVEGTKLDCRLNQN